MAFAFGIDVLKKDPQLQSQLSSKNVAIVAHPASVDSKLIPSADVIANISSCKLVGIFSPQHGFAGEKQDNMVESPHTRHLKHGVPIYSLYSETRKPTKKMLSGIDALLFDLQDIGCRIYTYLSTLVYLMESCSEHSISLWVLDRPNPAGPMVEGPLLDTGFYSFVGLAPTPMRHGATLGELALWYKALKNLPLDLKVVPMQGAHTLSPHRPWPQHVPWINPSPNIPHLHSCRPFAGTVLIEGTNLSEGRGTTRPLEVIGAPDIDAEKILCHMQNLHPEWMEGCFLRPCHFEPVFQKHASTLCHGVQIHTEDAVHDPHKFKAFRLVALFLKSLRHIYPDYNLWRSPPYEYETQKMPIDILSGSDFLQKWVDDPTAAPLDLEQHLVKAEQSWLAR